MIRALLKTQFIALLFLLIGQNTIAQWSNVNPIGAFPRYRGATFVIGDTAYLGNGDDPSYTNDFRKYTQASNTWVEMQSYPSSGADQGFRFTINDTAYIGDGASPGYHNDFYGYTPLAGWITTLGIPPGGDRVFSAGFSIGDTGYFGTGFSPSNFTFSDFYGYKQTANTWNTLASLPLGRAGGVAFSANGKGYMGLGYENNTAPGPNYQDMYQYDPVNNSWSAMASMPGPFGEGEPAYFVLCSKLIVVSGQRVHAGTGVDSATNQTWMFDPSNGPKGTWTRLQDFPGVPAYSPEGFAMGDTGFVVGGYTTPTGALSQMWRYVPSLVLTPALAADTVVCPGKQVTLNAAGGATYFWSTGDTTGSINDTATSITVSPLNTTTYYYTATGNPCFNLDSIVIKVQPGPALIIEPRSPKVCNGQSVTLNVSDTGNFSWTPSMGLNDTTGDSVVATPSVTTVYMVSGSDSLGCVSIGTDSVIVGDATALNIAPQDTSFCDGQIATLYIMGGGSNFIWIPATAISDSTLSGDSVIADPTVTTTYTAMGTNSSGCSATGSAVITVIPSPNKPTFSQDGDTLISSSKYDNQWFRNDTLLTNDTSQYLVITTGGSYRVIVNNEANGCSTSSDSMKVTTGINQLSAISNQLSIFPNPFNNNIFIKISSSAENVKDWTLQITDVLGRMLYSMSSLNYGNEIDLSNLPGGVYFITVINKTDRAIVPVVKQN